MRNAHICLVLVALFSVATAKLDYFSDVSDEDYKKLQEIARFLEKRVEEAEEVSDSQSQSSSNELNPPFQYILPTVNPENNDAHPFAVGPFDPRYYQDFGRSAELALEDSGEKKDKDRRPSLDGSGSPAVSETSNEVSSSYIRQVPVTKVYDDEGKADVYFTALVAGCSAAAIVAIVGIGIGCYRLQKNAKAAADVDYPAYGVTGPNKDVSPTSGDRRLAQSAQMYHYQHQKQQIIAMESMNNKERRSSISDAESEEENEEGDYTVYECPGLAPTGEMEVKNPLFQDDQTPASKKVNETGEESRELPK